MKKRTPKSRAFGDLVGIADGTKNPTHGTGLWLSKPWASK
jgi:hypothetical protein